MLSILKPIQKRVQSQFESDYTLAGLRLLIIAWAFFVIVLALIIDNKAVLAIILAYEVLP